MSAPSLADPFDLTRFLSAQESTFDHALGELRTGRKESHWMWFIFPQVAGLGRSPTAQHYAIKSKNEAEAYLAHPILGKRLSRCAEALLSIEGKTALEVLGSPDDLKLRSSMTLFDAIVPEPSPFRGVLQKYFHGEPDQSTLAILAGFPS